MFGLIFFVVVLIATLVLAFFASKVWHWAHVLVVVALVFATLGYTNLGYRVLAHRAKYQAAERRSLAALEETLNRIAAIDRGTEDMAMVSRLSESLGLDEDATSITSIGDLEYQLRMVNRVRGRLWENVRALGPPNQTGQVEVAIAEDAPPMNVSQGAILYAFEQGDPKEGASYLGEFRVVEAGPRQLRLEPVLEMHLADQERFIASAAQGDPWTLHESMPVDTHDMFAGMTEEQLRAILPESSVEEYLRDGTPAQPDDDPLRIMGIDADGYLVGPEEMDRAQKKIYSRKLRDYAFLFQEEALRQAELRAEGTAILANTKKLEEALAGAKKIAAYRQEEQRKLKHDLAGVTRDQKAIEQHLASVVAQADRAEQLLTKTLAANLRTAEQFAALQAAWAGGADLSTTPTPARPAGDPHAL